VGLHADAVLQKYVPADTTMLAGVEVEKVEQSPLYQRLQGQLNPEHVNEIVQQFGFDPRKDVAAVLIASNGRETVALARGRFPVQQLQAKFEQDHMRRNKYKGHEFFEDGKHALIFLRKDVMAAADIATIKRLVDQTVDGQGGISAALQERLAHLRKDATVWVVSDHGLPLMGVPLRQDVESALSNIRGYVTGVTAGTAFDDGVHFQGDVDCISPEGAQRVHDALRGGIGLARLATNDNAMDMLRLYDSINVDKSDKQVKVSADVAGSLIDKVWPRLPQMGARVRQRMENAQ
jgi:hypothetical protein